MVVVVGESTKLATLTPSKIAFMVKLFSGTKHLHAFMLKGCH